MIKIGIIGADCHMSGELLRILVAHPEVEITTLFAPEVNSHRISSVHHGFIGEQTLYFTDKIDPSSIDAVFVVADSPIATSIIEHIGEWEQLRIINLSPSRFKDWSSSEFEYGLSEINRKALVRGARMALIPSPVASISLIALNPLASHLLLSSDIDISVGVPGMMVDRINIEEIEQEISGQLKRTQNSFNGKVKLNITTDDSPRAIRVNIGLKCPLDSEEISKIYESIYDDHNFSFLTRNKLNNFEVEGTQKCVISFTKESEDYLKIEAIGDIFLRGGAGDAVHILNLLFSLHEKIGLALKPSQFGNIPSKGELNTSWFA